MNNICIKAQAAFAFASSWTSFETLLRPVYLYLPLPLTPPFSLSLSLSLAFLLSPSLSFCLAPNEPHLMQMHKCDLWQFRVVESSCSNFSLALVTLCLSSKHLHTHTHISWHTHPLTHTQTLDVIHHFAGHLLVWHVVSWPINAPKSKVWPANYHLAAPTGC